jgi:hypothetical protein
VYYKKSRAAM